MRTAALATLIWLALATPAAAQQGPTQAQVQQAIDRAIQFLRTTQDAEGRWSMVSMSRGGVWRLGGEDRYAQGATALSVYAMLLAGVPANDPAVQKGIRYMLSRPLQVTYCVSLVALALTEAGPRTYRAHIERCARWLETSQLASGTWSYQSYGARRAVAGLGDNSNAQFGVLGLWACERAGVKIDEKVWERIRVHWRGSQLADGGWAYRAGSRAGKPSMTLAGIGSLLIAGARLHKPVPQ